MTRPADGTPRLSLREVQKSFFGNPVLRSVSFEAFPGEIVGIIGENGCGKSTTMNIISGIHAPDGGDMRLDGTPYTPASRQDSTRRGIAFVQQELNIFPNLTIAENLLLGALPPLLRPRGMRKRALALLDAVGLRLDPAAKAGTLSAGERQLVEIARALGLDARIIIMDEPTTSLTDRERERLFSILSSLRDRGVTILFVTHVLEDILRLTDQVVVMRDGAVTLDRRTSGATLGALVGAMVGRQLGMLFPDREPALGPPHLRVSAISEPGVVESIDFTVARGEIVGLVGLMGAGRTELARIIFGLDRHRDGEIIVAGCALPPGDIGARLDAGTAFLTEDRRAEGLLMNAPLADNIELAALPGFSRPLSGWVNGASLRRSVDALVARLNLRGGSLAQPARSFSGGNQQKAMLGRWLLRKPSLLILDEPTRGVDIGAKQEIYALLANAADQGMAILLISSELEEAMGLADRILVMRAGRLEAEFGRPAFDREAILAAAFGQNAGSARAVETVG